MAASLLTRLGKQQECWGQESCSQVACTCVAFASADGEREGSANKPSAWCHQVGGAACQNVLQVCPLLGGPPLGLVTVHAPCRLGTAELLCWEGECDGRANRIAARQRCVASLSMV